jgi:hypothetical protein
VADILPIISGSTLPRIAWDSVLDDATIASTNTTEDDGLVAQCVDWHPWTFWRPTGTGPYIIEATLAEELTVTAWAFAGHDADGTVLMETWDGSDWVEHSTASCDGSGAVVYLNGDPISTTQLRFTFDDISFLAILWAGEDLELPEGVGPGWTDPLLALRADINPEVSRLGVWLGATIEQWSATLKLDIRNVEATWARDEWVPFLRTCSARPFFLHWNNVEWPSSACLCTKAMFGDSSFSQNGFVSLSVSFDADPGVTRRMDPTDDSAELLTEDADGALELE